MALKIRLALKTDAPRIAGLSRELGYEISEEKTLENIKIIEKSEFEIVFVAVLNDELVGWIQMSCITRLESGTFCEITGLVIDKKQRGNGIGRQLVDTAIDWSRNHNSTTVRVRSNIVRNDAHRFYEQLGFVMLKQQKIFELSI